MKRSCAAAVAVLIGLVSLGFTATPAAAGREPTLVRITSPYPEQAAELEAAGFDMALKRQDRLEILAFEGDLERLERLGIGYEIVERDLIPGGRSKLEGNLDPEYHTYDEMLAELFLLQETYSQICKVYDIGDALSRSYTWGNYNHAYDIWALRISDQPATDEAEPCVIYDARHHAREPVSTEIVLAVARYFCENYGVLPQVTDVVDRTEIWIVPMVNPDGHQWVEEVDPWWRKTLYDTNGNHSVDEGEGIDPNRNYDWHWAQGDWWSQTYGGPSPFSAPEVVALRDLQLQHRACINPSYHSYGEVVLYPFGYGVLAEPAVLGVANELGTLISYDVEQSTTANGSSKDWAYGVIGAASFTVETATEFIPSGPQMLNVVNAVLPGSVWLASRALGPSIQGAVVDSLTGAPLAATIHIPEIHDVYGDGELLDMQTEAATGSFCRIRPYATETITLEVGADGYVPKTLQLTTGGTAATVVEIRLRPEVAAVAMEGLAPGVMALGRNRPNPFNPSTVLPFSLAAAGEVSLEVFDASGRKIAVLVDGRRDAGSHVVHWDGTDQRGGPVASGVYIARLKAGGQTETRSMVLLR